MGLRDMLKKKDRLDQGYNADAETVNRLQLAPEFTFIRSDTNTQEVIYPPNHQHHSSNKDDGYLTAKDSGSKPRRSLDVFKSRSRGNSTSSHNEKEGSSAGQRLSQRLHLSREPATSSYVPSDLPAINVSPMPGGNNDKEAKEATEREWESRATQLAAQNETARSRSTSPMPHPALRSPSPSGRGHSDGVVSSQRIDEDIQEAIRLHEAGDLERSTALFGQLANPQGANNPLSQVLYGLALRHGWGCEPDLPRAVTFLSAAASNAAEIEDMALKAGLKKGGAAKGELVLAIFELANCFRQGWGIPKDAVAAKQYYETAANLGDTDAMNEVAWCYLEGFGCKKDKFAAAKYYRLAEQNGNKTLGNSWIWKDKYDPDGKHGNK